MSHVLDIDHVQLAMPPGREQDARAFWVEIVGLEERPRPESFAGRGGLWLAVGARSLHLGVEQDFRPAKKAHPAFVAADLDQLADRLTASDAPVVWAEDVPGVRRFFSEDPFGNRLEFLATRHTC